MAKSVNAIPDGSHSPAEIQRRGQDAFTQWAATSGGTGA